MRYRGNVSDGSDRKACRLYRPYGRLSAGTGPFNVNLYFLDPALRGFLSGALRGYARRERR